MCRRYASDMDLPFSMRFEYPENVFGLKNLFTIGLTHTCDTYYDCVSIHVSVVITMFLPTLKLITSTEQRQFLFLLSIFFYFTVFASHFVRSLFELLLQSYFSQLLQMLISTPIDLIVSHSLQIIPQPFSLQMSRSFIRDDGYGGLS